MHKNKKKAVSEMVAVTLLIVIAVGISVLVYGFLKLYVPKEKIACPDGINLIISQAVCDTTNIDEELTIDFVNKGRFSIDGVYIRLGEEGKNVRKLINLPVVPPVTPPDPRFYFSPSLVPDERRTKPFTKADIDPEIILVKDRTYILEIQPAVIDKNSKGKLAACENAIVTQKITCGTGAGGAPPP